MRNEFTDMVDNENLDPTLARKMQKEVLKAAVMRQIFCQVSGTILDVRTAVLVLAPGQSVCVTGVVWDAQRDKIETAAAAANTAYEVYDGRELSK